MLSKFNRFSCIHGKKERSRTKPRGHGESNPSSLDNLVQNGPNPVSQDVWRAPRGVEPRRLPGEFLAPEVVQGPRVACPYRIEQKKKARKHKGHRGDSNPGSLDNFSADRSVFQGVFHTPRAKSKKKKPSNEACTAPRGVEPRFSGKFRSICPRRVPEIPSPGSSKKKAETIHSTSPGGSLDISMLSKFNRFPGAGKEGKSRTKPVMHQGESNPVEVVPWDAFNGQTLGTRRPQMPLDRLDPDVLLQIFALLDVFTIVSLSRVSAKQLWLLVVREIFSRGLIDPPGNAILEALSTAELVAEVKRVVVGPRTWASTSSDPPTLRRRREFSIDPHLQSLNCHFLEDGRDIVFYQDTSSGPLPGGVECFDVYTGRRVWNSGTAAASPGHSIELATFDFCRSRSKAVIAVVITVMNTRRGDIVILEADFETGGSRELLRFAITVAFLPRVQVSDDFFGFQMSGGRFMLINWRTAKFILFNPPYEASSFAWVPGHIIFGCPKSQSVSLDPIRIHSLASLDHLWRPVSEYSLDNFQDPCPKSTTFPSRFPETISTTPV
ncbi:hypothetical protein B0H17DRAFT_1277646 [Mycena rosella]|uniref:F-box domain-containing protein n=1 Tax=Mycena rosella TaxID=1033263 RepID=A0AAD7C3L9_MYCRO|nr:hypothetical protein B0H17DRAFT_1277646 [Mycena rosella]